MKRETQITRQILQMIQHEHLGAGSRLPSERVLARQLKTSRHTIRVAIRKLEANGLLQVRMGSGYYVLSSDTPPPTIRREGPTKELHDLQQLFEARYLFEPTIGALAAEKASPMDIQALENCLMRIGRAILTADITNFTEENRRFRNHIASCTANGLFEKTARQLSADGRLFFGIFEQFQKIEREAIFADYVAIVNAIKDGNPDLTCAYIQQHILRVCRLLTRYSDVELPSIIRREIRERPEAEE